MKLLTTLCILLITVAGFSQSTAAHLENDSFEEEAKKLTELYSAELGLRAKQELLVEKKIEQYLIKANEVKQNYEGREMLDRLVVLQQQETLDMNDILTQIQMDVYKKVKPRIQPLATVKE